MAVRLQPTGLTHRARSSGLVSVPPKPSLLSLSKGWSAFLKGLVKRGLEGVNPRIKSGEVISDAHDGLRLAITRVLAIPQPPASDVALAHPMPGAPMPISLTVNGSEVAVAADPDTPLLDVLRNHLGLVGAKFGCGLEQCGCCMVLIDGTAREILRQGGRPP